MARAVKVKDLPDRIGSNGPRELLYCPQCGAEYSACKGDYFMASPEHVFRCCRRNMLLVTKREVYSEVA